MKFLSRLSLKKFSVFAVFLGIFIVAFPAVSVFAASQSPSDLNIFSITSGEQNKQLNRNCGYSTAEGLLAGSLSALEQIAAVRFEDYAEKVYCEEGDITGLFNSDKSTGVLGVLNKVNNTILAQRPASGVQFIEDKVYAITNPGVVHADEPPSYFPGTGFDLLQPIRGFWGWAVNLVFGVLVILIIFVAFAIIFRVKLPGNVTVTLQNSIPNIALAMILVPLSYAISGLFIDAITIGTNAIHDFLLGPASPGYSVYASRDTNGNDRGLYVDDDRVTWINARSLVDVSQEVEGVALQTGLDAGPLQVVGSFLNIFDEDTINANSANPGGTSAWLGTIINALLSIFMIWIGIKIFIRLFKKYITLMITPIFAPFVFATVAVPGNGTKAIMNFVKLMGSASLGFIVTYGMILLTVIFSSEAFQATIPNMNTGLWNPPLLGLGSFINPAQTIGGVVSNSSVVPFIMALISIGIYFSIPNVLDQIDQALGGNMSIPKFIMTPIESFRESYRVTGGAFRGAVITGARGVNVARNSPEAARQGVNYFKSGKFADSMNRRFNYGRNARLQREKDLNIAGLEGTETARISDELNERYAAATNKYNTARRDYSEAQRTGNQAGMRKAESDMAQASQSIEDIKELAKPYDIKLSAEQKKEDLFEMKVEFQSYVGGQNNALLFSRDTLINIFINGERTIRKAGKLVFTLQGNDYGFANGDIIEVGPVGRREEVERSSKDPSDEIIDTRPSFIKNGATMINSIVPIDLTVRGNNTFDLFKRTRTQGRIERYSFRDSLVIYPDSEFDPATAISDNGKQYTIPVSLRIENPTVLFGNMQGDIASLNVSWIGGELPAAPDVRPTDKVAFRIMNRSIVSNSFNIRVGKK